MKDLLLIGCELLTALLPLCIAALMLRYARGEGGGGKRWLVLCFVLWLFVLLHATGAGTIYELRRYGLAIRAEQINLRPFSDPDMDVIGYCLNVLLFVPAGLLLPLIWPEWDRLPRVFAFGVSLSLLVELSQLLNMRRTDVDDLILNTAGVIVGFVIYKLLWAKREGAEAEGGRPGWEPLVYTASMFLGRFLLFNELAAAKLLYGF